MLGVPRRNRDRGTLRSNFTFRVSLLSDRIAPAVAVACAAAYYIPLPTALIPFGQYLGGCAAYCRCGGYRCSKAASPHLPPRCRQAELYIGWSRTAQGCHLSKFWMETGPKRLGTLALYERPGHFIRSSLLGLPSQDRPCGGGGNRTRIQQMRSALWLLAKPHTPGDYQTVNVQKEKHSL